VLDPIAKLYLHKDEDLPSVSADQDPARSALARLKARLPALHRRSLRLARVAAGGALVAFLGALLSYFQTPTAPPAWHRIVYPASLRTFASAAHSLNGMALMLAHFFDGPLGFALSIAVLMVGVGIGVANNSPMPLISGISLAMFLYFGPSILSTTIRTSDGAALSSPSPQTLTVAQLERLRMAHPAPRTALALLWVITQKEYFGTPGTHFVRDVALLDTAHFAHDRNLPRSATTARLLVLSQAAHLSAEVAALQREQTETLDRERQGAQRSADMAEAGTGVAFAFGIPAVFLWRRKRRLQRKLEGSAEMGPEIQAVSGS